MLLCVGCATRQHKESVIAARRRRPPRSAVVQACAGGNPARPLRAQTKSPPRAHARAGQPLLPVVPPSWRAPRARRGLSSLRARIASRRYARCLAPRYRKAAGGYYWPGISGVGPASRPGGLHQPDQRVASSRHQAPGFHLPQLAVARFARTVPRDDDLLIGTVWTAPVAPVKPPRGPPSIRETACVMRCSSPPGAGGVDLRLLRPIDRQRRGRGRLEVVARSF